MSRTDTPIGTKSRWVAEDLGVGREWGVKANGNRISFWGDENVLEWQWWQLHNFVNTLNTTELSTLKGDFFVLLSELYLNLKKKNPSHPVHSVIFFSSVNSSSQVDIMCIWDKTAGTFLSLHLWSEMLPRPFFLPLPTPSPLPLCKVQIKSHFFQNTFHP